MSIDLLSRDHLVQHKGAAFDYVSASRLNLWLKCPLAFRLKYIDGVRTSSSPAAFVGKAVHAGLEHFYRHRQLGVTLSAFNVIQGAYREWEGLIAHEKMSFASAAEELDYRNQAAALVQTYVQHVSIDVPRPLGVELAVEAPLIDPANGEDLQISLVGILDLVVPDADGPLIVDFKTTSRRGEPLELLHEIQLSCYAYLFRYASGLHEGGLEIRNLIKTKVPQVQFHRYAPRSETHFQRLFAVIRAYLAMAQEWRIPAEAR